MWTLEELRARPFIREAEAHLWELMRKAGKTRFQTVAAEKHSAMVLYSDGYVIELDMALPHGDVVYLHELLHGILLEEGYPIAVSDRVLHSPETTGRILEDCTNCVHHVEIFRRMAGYGADMDRYFAYRADELQPRFRRIIAKGDWHIAARHLDPLVVFDTFLMGTQGEALRAGYADNAKKVCACCREAAKTIAGIGCQSPDRARASLSAFCQEMASLCHWNQLHEAKQFWNSVSSRTVLQRPLPPCPEWVAGIPAPPAAVAPPAAAPPPAPAPAARPRWRPWTWLKRRFGWE